MFKATVTEMVQNAATRCADVQVVVLKDRIENKKEKSIIGNKMPFNINFYFILFYFILFYLAKMYLRR